ncbi:neuropeptides B/W receptor type 1-like [Asterias amurensis]|uniref:neuropeptides B/W receptor type 1-like n=1 Tax=Asterias amurensis TaxID=7602 RepID=UPI003AB4B4F0
MSNNFSSSDDAASTTLPTLIPVLFAREQPLRYAAPSVMVITLLIGVVGNACLLLVNLRAKRSKSCNVLDVPLTTLAIVDLVLLVVTGPFFAVEFVLEDWPFGDAACRLLLPVNHLTETVGAYTVGLLALDECLVIALPNSYARRRDLKAAVASNLAVCFISVLLTIPAYIFTTNHQTTYRASFCTMHMPNVAHGIQLYAFVVCFCIPQFITLSCLLWIFYKSNGNLWRPANDESQPRSKQTRAVVLLIASLSGAQILLWLPYHIVSFLRPGIFSPAITRQDVHSYTALACYGYAYSAIKPMLYIFINEDIRNRFVGAIPLGWGKGIQGIRHGAREPNSPVHFQFDTASGSGRVPSMSSLRTIPGYPNVGINGEAEGVMDCPDRSWRL